jgi:hypothetical protein
MGGGCRGGRTHSGLTVGSAVTHRYPRFPLRKDPSVSLCALSSGVTTHPAHCAGVARPVVGLPDAQGPPLHPLPLCPFPD